MDFLRRLEDFRGHLESSGLKCYLVTDVKNVYYLTGFLDIADSHLSLIIPVDSQPTLLTYSLSYVAASEKAEGCQVKQVDLGKLPESTLKEVVSLRVEEAYFDKLDFKTYTGFKKEGVDMKQELQPIWRLRSVKDECEVNYMRKAAELADVGLQAGLEAVKAEAFEYEIAAEAEYAMRKNGSEGTAFETVVASGPRSAFPHGVCSDRRIEIGDFVTLDLGAVYRGYRSDATRTTIVGEASKKQREIYDLVLRAHEEAFNYIRPETTGKAMDKVARKIITDAGYGEMFVHGLGHGVGLDIHEPPYLTPRSEDVLKVGNIVTDEPGIYVRGFGGVRIEDAVLVLEDGAERLTKTMRELEV